MISIALSLLTPFLLGQASASAQAQAAQTPAVQSQGANKARAESNAAARAEGARLNACVDKIDQDAEEAYEDGLKWLYETNRAPARQCVAMALIALGQPAQGAARLEELASAKDAGTLDQRANYLVQAGNAWMLANAPEAAIVTLNNALKLRPKDADIHKDEARAFILMKKWDEAGRELDTAITLSPGDADSHAMRAETLIERGKLDAAGDDIKAARKLAPRSVPIIVLRGRLVEARRLKGLPEDPSL